ncbi:hypothetical protein ACFLRI_05085, partial [Bacteroidota bacterium]
TVSESLMVLGGDKNNTLSVTIYETNEETVTKEWKNLLKKMGAKITIKDEISATNANLKDMSDLPFNCFSSITTIDHKTIQLNVCVYLGGGYLNYAEHAGKYKTFAKLMSDFAQKITIESIENELKMAKDSKKLKEEELSRLVSDKGKLESRIREWESEIQKAKDDIEINILEQQSKRKEVQVADEEIKNIKNKLDLSKK